MTFAVGWFGLALGVDPINDNLTTIQNAWIAHDFQTRLHSVTIDRGHQYRWDQFQPATATFVLDDTDFGFDPIAIPTLTPFLPVRFGMKDHTGTAKNQFVGFVKPRDGYGFNFTGPAATTTIQCYDILGWLSSRIINTGGNTYDAIHTGDLITAVTADHVTAGNPPLFTAWMSGGPGYVTNGQTLFGGPISPDGIDALTFFQKVQESEGGAVYHVARPVVGDAASAVTGRLQFDNRAAWFSETRQNSAQATFSVTAKNISYMAGYQASFAETFTSASVTTVANPAATYTYSSGTTSYGDQPFPPITGSYVTGAAESVALAARIVGTSQPTYFPSQITINARKSDTLLDAACNLDLRDRIDITTADSTGHTTYQCHIESVHHAIDFRANTWEVTYGLSSRTQLLNSQSDSGHLFILDDATTGKLDGSRQLVF